MKRVNIQHNKQGFLLVEVVLMMAMLSTVLLSLFGLQSSMFKNVFLRHNKIERIFYLRNVFFNPEVMDDFRQEPTNQTPFSEILSEPSLRLELKTAVFSEDEQKKYPDIYKLISEGSWQGMFKEHSELIVSYLNVQPKDEEEGQESTASNKGKDK